MVFAFPSPSLTSRVNRHLPCSRRQISEGVWKSPDDLSVQSQKRTEDVTRGSDLDILNSPPLSLTDLSTSAGLANWRPVSGADADASGPEQDVQPSMTFRNRILDELPSRRPGDKSVSAEVRLVITAQRFPSFDQRMSITCLFSPALHPSCILSGG